MVDWPTVLVSVGGSLAVVEYRIYRGQSVDESNEVSNWYGDTAAYAAEIRRVWQRKWDRSDVARGNFSETSSEISLLEGQMSRHASEGEQLDVDQSVVDALDEVANRCREVSEHTGHLNDSDEIEEYRNQILDAVEVLEEALESR